MVDIVDKPTRSRMMASIKGKNTKPELILRRELHSRGFRYRLHSGDVFGKPDLVLPKFKAAIFVHGCFWHRHAGCRFTTIPSTRKEFWRKKFESNVARDMVVRINLMESGWRVATVWECALKSSQQIDKTTNQLTAWLSDGNVEEIEIGI